MAVDDEFGYHELLHAAHIMSCMWAEHISGHGLLENDPDLKAEAERIGAEIYGFYQTVSNVSDAKFGKG